MPVKRRDDSGIAGVVGFVLLFAVALAIFARSVHTDLPAYGAEAERSWDGDVASAFRQADAALALHDGPPATISVPPPPDPRALDAPLLGHAEPVRATGVVAFVPSCAAFTATHTLANGSTVSDVWGGSTGCLTFLAATPYSAPFGERIEFGGVLRVQGGRAVVVQGPPVELTITSPTVYRVSLGLSGLRGPAATFSIDRVPVRVDLVPGPSTAELEQAPNAASAQWTLATQYPGAWKAWWSARIDQSGFAGASVVCQPVDCSLGATGRGFVIISLAGPAASGADMRLSVAYGLTNVGLR